MWDLDYKEGWELKNWCFWTVVLEKTLMLGRIGGRRRRRRQRMRWLNGITNLMDMSLSELRGWWWTGRPGVLEFMGLQRVRHDWVTELKLVIAFLPRKALISSLISWLQSPYAVILEPPKIKSLTVSTVSPSICHEVMEPDAMILVFWMLSFKPTFSFSSFTYIKRHFSSSLSAVRVVSSAYLRLVIFLPAILIPACAWSSPAFRMIYSAYKLNKQGDNTQPCRTPFLIWHQSVVSCTVLTVSSWPPYRFLRRQVRWSGIHISFRILHSLLWST